MNAIESFKQYSMAFSEGRAEFLYAAVQGIVLGAVPGELVETGVYKGGNLMLMAHALKEAGAERIIWGYDTFEGMPEPSEHDIFHNGRHAKDIWHEGWCEAGIDEVDKNMQSVGYPHYRLIKGRTERTTQEVAPDEIAILRLDTDFYASTRAELVNLFPKLSEGGVLIVDDYASWAGSRKGCDEILPNREFSQIGTSNAYYLTK